MNVKNLTWSIALHIFQSSVFQILAYQFPHWLSHKPLNLKRCFNKVWSSGKTSAIRSGRRPRVRPPDVNPIEKPTASSTASLAEARLRSVRASRVSRPWMVLASAQRFRPASVLQSVESSPFPHPPLNWSWVHPCTFTLCSAQTMGKYSNRYVLNTSLS